MDVADRLALHELPGRYGDLIDNRDWEGLSQIFLDSATFEVPTTVMKGLAEIQAFMASCRHPRTHLMTNTYVEESPEEVVLRFRIVAMREDGTIGSGRYRDVVVKGPQGWRVASRVYTATPHKEPPAAP
jgi:3-phenylpropionate/cinnamic acid dioxygenase small subunit